MDVSIWASSIIGMVVAAFGLEGRGRKSPLIAGIGSTVWLAACAVGFWKHGFKLGGLLFVVTIVVGSIARGLFARLFYSWRRRA